MIDLQDIFPDIEKSIVGNLPLGILPLGILPLGISDTPIPSALILQEFHTWSQGHIYIEYL
jgi:hypothetical protein